MQSQLKKLEKQRNMRAKEYQEKYKKRKGDTKENQIVTPIMEIPTPQPIKSKPKKTAS
jgi:hypothetical protein